MSLSPISKCGLRMGRPAGACSPHRRLCIAMMIGLMSLTIVSARAQTGSRNCDPAELVEVGRLVESGHAVEAAERMSTVCATPVPQPPQAPGEFQVNPYDFVWSAIVEDLVDQGQYQVAERVLMDRIAAGSKLPGAANLAVSSHQQMLASLYLKRGRFAEAQPVLESVLLVHRAAGLSEAFSSFAYRGYAEVLLAAGRAHSAVEVLQGFITRTNGHPDLDIQDTLTVALREAGDMKRADAAEQLVDAAYPRQVSAQQRDFLRARLKANKGLVTEAEQIFLQWIRYWEGTGEGGDKKEVEKDRESGLVAPLEAYRDFLRLYGSAEDARKVAERLDGIRKKYETR